jgi:hypothetical protein
MCFQLQDNEALTVTFLYNYLMSQMQGSPYRDHFLVLVSTSELFYMRGSLVFMYE